MSVPMAPRPLWKGYLKLSLVSCAVNLYPALTSSYRTRFHTLNRATGHRVSRQFIDSETGDVVETEDQVKGYEIAKGEHVIVEKDELEKVPLESTHTIDIDSFAKVSDVDMRLRDTPYYLVPDGRVAQEAFAVIRDSMKSGELVALSRTVLARRERIVLLEPFENGILATTLHFEDEVRDAKAAFEEIEDLKPDAELMQLASHIMKQKLKDFDIAAYKDRYEERLADLLTGKTKALPVMRQEDSRPSNIINLVDVLRKSLEQEGGKPKSVRTAKTTRKPKSRARSTAKAKSSGYTKKEARR
jgi:DNA end-binding protein Ku